MPHAGINLERFNYQDPQIYKEATSSTEFFVERGIDIITPDGKQDKIEFTIIEIGEPQITFARQISIVDLEAEEKRMSDEWFKI